MGCTRMVVCRSRLSRHTGKLNLLLRMRRAGRTPVCLLLVLLVLTALLIVSARCTVYAVLVCVMSVHLLA